MFTKLYKVFASTAAFVIAIAALIGTADCGLEPVTPPLIDSSHSATDASTESSDLTAQTSPDGGVTDTCVPCTQDRDNSYCTASRCGLKNGSLCCVF